MNCQDFEELVGAYALGALTDEERQAADAHLAICASCRQTLQECRAVVDLLPLAVPGVEPSAALKERILAPMRAEAVYQDQAQSQRPARKGSPPVIRRTWSTWSTIAAAVMLCIVLAGMVGWNISLRQQLDRLSANSLSVTTYTIHGTAQAAQASGQVVYIPQLHITTLVIHGLPALEGTHIYQGWLIKGDQPQSVGLLNEQDGTATLNFQGDVRGYDSLAISREQGPQASKDAPKGQVVAVGPLKHPQSLAAQEMRWDENVDI